MRNERDQHVGGEPAIPIQFCSCFGEHVIGKHTFNTFILSQTKKKHTQKITVLAARGAACRQRLKANNVNTHHSGRPGS
jgi:hypothetical protein